MLRVKVVIDAAHITVGSQRQSDARKKSLRVELVARSGTGIVRQGQELRPQSADGGTHTDVSRIQGRAGGSTARAAVGR